MRYTRKWYPSRQQDNLCVFLIVFVLCYVLIHISTGASTLSTASRTFQRRFATGTAQSVTSHLTVTSHNFQQRFRSNIHVTLHGHQPRFCGCRCGPRLVAPEGTHGGYVTWQLIMSEEGFPAAQNVYWWLPSDESAAISIYLVCHPLYLCTGLLVLLLLRLICQRV